MSDWRPRFGLGRVSLAVHNTNLTPLVTGPMIELSERHAKMHNNR
jgi:hypothetical protein